MRCFLFIIINLLLLGCNKNESFQPSEKCKIASEIRTKVAKKLAQEQGLIPFGTGGQMLDQIRMLGLYFQYRKPVSIEEGRKLLVHAVQALLTEVNADERVRPYLDHFPFQPKNVIITISLQKPGGSDFGRDQLCIIKANEGILQYKIDDPNGHLKEIYRETYEEAWQKVVGYPRLLEEGSADRNNNLILLE